MRSSPPNSKLTRRALLLGGGGLVLAVLLAYWNSFAVPFVFDDVPAIADNHSIRQLWSLGRILLPELQDAGVTVSGRPLVNLSLAVNYALGRTQVGGYHAVNLLIHGLATLFLFGLVSRTFRQPVLIKRFGLDDQALGLAVAAIWALHPLQTESVTYVVQRAESLMGLAYFLTLYAFVRSLDSARPWRWLTLSLAACLAGMASKEVMVSAPLMVFLYDRTFAAGSFRAAWKRRRLYYATLASTWLLLAYLVFSSAGRGGTAGFGTEVSSWEYALTQCQAIVHYLKLAVWPHPLVFDYGTGVVRDFAAVWLHALFLVGLVGITALAIVRWPLWGFVGAWFFALLAPSSSIVPVVSQTMAEHRMYLPLVAVVVPAVVGLYLWIGRRSFYLWAVLSVLGAVLTSQRNHDYRSELALWEDTVSKYPANSRAYNNLGKALMAESRAAEALTHFKNAIQLGPKMPEPHNNLALALARLDRNGEAIVEYGEAIRLQPAYPEAYNNLGTALYAEKRLGDAVEQYEAALRFRPAFAEAHSNLANVLLEMGLGSEAIRHAEEAVRLDPDYVEGRYNLGNALASSGQLSAALGQYENALKLKPDYADVVNNLGNVLVELDRLPEAIARYEQAVRLQPDYFEPRRNLAILLSHLGRKAEAIEQYRELMRLRPDDKQVQSEFFRLQQ